MTQGCLDYIFKAAYGHEVVHLVTDPHSSPTRDADDWQFDPELYWEYCQLYGPFEIDACADNRGYNAQLAADFWCPSDSCLDHS